MRRFILGVFAAATLLFLIPAAQSSAQGHYHGGGGWHGGGGGWHGGTRVVVGFGPAWGYGFGWGPGWFPPSPYYYGAGYYGAPYAYGPPVIVSQQAPEYVQQEPQQNSLAPGYWYYCAKARAYYPSVPTCQEAWIPVPPAPQDERDAR